MGANFPSPQLSKNEVGAVKIRTPPFLQRQENIIAAMNTAITKMVRNGIALDVAKGREIER